MIDEGMGTRWGEIGTFHIRMGGIWVSLFPPFFNVNNKLRLVRLTSILTRKIKRRCELVVGQEVEIFFKVDIVVRRAND